MYCTIQASNHPGAGARVPTTDARESWFTVFDGKIATKKEAREAVDALAQFYRHARCFVGSKTLGKLHYAVLRTH